MGTAVTSKPSTWAAIPWKASMATPPQREVPSARFPSRVPDEPREGAARRLCVYLLEDNPGDIALIRAYLSAEGPCDIIGFTAMSELKMIEASPPDVVLLDLRLPDARDEEVVRRTHEILVEVPMVVLTGVEDGLVARRCLELGADDYIEKNSLSPESLRRALAFAVARGRARTLQARLRSSERLASLGRLAAGVAHEINNPATSVLVNLELIARSLSDLAQASEGSDPRLDRVLPELRDMVEDAKQGTERIARIVRELSNFSRMDHESLEAFSPTVLMKRARSLTAHRIPEGVSVIQESAATLLAAGDVGKIEQVLVNVLSNAGDAMEGCAGTIHIACHVVGTRLVFSVEDQGPGIDDLIADRIFDPFFTTKQRGEGTGLGLAISAEAAQRMGGDLRLVRSGPLGSRFELSLPFVEPADAKPNVTRAGQWISGRRWRVLLIDDDANVLTSWTRVLSVSHDLRSVSSAEAAIALLKSGAIFDVILCDLVMPGMGGAGFFRELQKDRPALLARLVLTTGGLVDDSAHAFVISTGLQVLEKPVRLAQLRACVDSVALAAEAVDNSA